MNKFELRLLEISEIKKDVQGRINVNRQHLLYYSGVRANDRAKEGLGFILTEELDHRLLITDIKFENIKVRYNYHQCTSGENRKE